MSRTPSLAALRRLAAAAALLAAAVPASAAGFAWSEGRTTADEAALLFETACLGTLPDFAGADALFKRLGFVRRPGMLMQNHAGKNMSALAMADESDPAGARSCAIIADGLGQAAAERAVAPLVNRHFGTAAERHENAGLSVGHVVWTRESGRSTVKVIVTESDNAAFIGVTVLPSFAGAPR